MDKTKTNLEPACTCAVVNFTPGLSMIAARNRLCPLHGEKPAQKPEGAERESDAERFDEAWEGGTIR
jgi:hypothetical protein